MKLKGLLKLVTGLVVSVPTSLSIVACGTATVTKKDLKTITQLSGVNFSLDTTKKYSAFDSAISTATEFSAKPMQNFTVKYYDGATGGNDITDQNQTRDSKVYIVITASETDPYWTGATSDTTRIAVTINKVNLSTITSLTGLNITADSSQLFNKLNDQIATATEFSTKPIQNFTVKYYDAVLGGAEITNNNQGGGTVYVVITAGGTDPYWTGATSNTNRLNFGLYYP